MGEHREYLEPSPFMRGLVVAAGLTLVTAGLGLILWGLIEVLA
jgi:hypothetical protein